MAWITSEQSKAMVGDDRYTGWGEVEAKADMAAKGTSSGGGSSGSSSSSSSSSNYLDELVDLIAKMGASPTVLPEISVKSWEEYETIALEELKPYYERLLKEEGGDIEKAKARLLEDYERGVRINTEQAETNLEGFGPEMQQGESTQSYYNRAKGEYGTFPEESIALAQNMNKRGILYSGIANTEASKLATSQQRRQEAINNALKNYVEEAGITKERGIQDLATEWERRQWELDQQKAEDAANLARQKRSDDVDTQEIERENLMRKAVQNIYY